MGRDYVPIIDHYSMESPVATELRRLLHNLEKCQGKPELKSILFTSATTAEGKSTVCSLLGITAAVKGHKTLVMDCDMRRPTLHRLFGMEREHGMVEVLSGEVEMKGVIKKTALENLDVVTAGKATPQPTELFDARTIGGLVNELKFYYDYIFIDTPPVIPVSDPMLLAQETDGAILVIKVGATAREVVRRASEIMGNSQTNLLGVVLNNVKGSLPYYYDHSHYHYEYSQSIGGRKTSGKKQGSRKSSRNGTESGANRKPGSSNHNQIPR